MAAERSVALCVARFYTVLAEKLVEGARAALDEAGVTAIEEVGVPGAFELPLVAKLAAESGRFAAVVCLGAVIRGETDHYDYVCQAASDGILRVGLDTGVPCGFGVLTVDTMEQALERVSGGVKRDTGRYAVEDHRVSEVVERVRVGGAVARRGGDRLLERRDRRPVVAIEELLVAGALQLLGGGDGRRARGRARREGLSSRGRRPVRRAPRVVGGGRVGLRVVHA